MKKAYILTISLLAIGYFSYNFSVKKPSDTKTKTLEVNDSIGEESNAITIKHGDIGSEYENIAAKNNETNSQKSHKTQKPEGTIIDGVLINPDIDMSPERQVAFIKNNPKVLEENIRKKHPVIDRILLLTKDKALKSKKDREEIAELIASEKLLSDFSTEVQKVPDLSNQEEDILRRKFQIDFINEALQKEDHPNKKAIVTNLKSSFYASTITEDLKLLSKKALVVEKMDILSTLYRHDRAAYDEIVANRLVYKDNKVLNYVVENFSKG